MYEELHCSFNEFWLWMNYGSTGGGGGGSFYQGRGNTQITTTTTTTTTTASTTTNTTPTTTADDPKKTPPKDDPPAKDCTPHGLGTLKPDYVKFQASVGLFAGVSVSLSVDRFGNGYFGVGPSIGRGIPVSTSVTAGYITGPSSPWCK